MVLFIDLRPHELEVPQPGIEGQHAHPLPPRHRRDRRVGQADFLVVVAPQTRHRRVGILKGRYQYGEHLERVPDQLVGSPDRDLRVDQHQPVGLERSGVGERHLGTGSLQLRHQRYRRLVFAVTGVKQGEQGTGVE